MTSPPAGSTSASTTGAGQRRGDGRGRGRDARRALGGGEGVDGHCGPSSSTSGSLAGVEDRETGLAGAGCVDDRERHVVEHQQARGRASVLAPPSSSVSGSVTSRTYAVPSTSALSVPPRRAGGADDLDQVAGPDRRDGRELAVERHGHDRAAVGDRVLGRHQVLVEQRVGLDPGRGVGADHLVGVLLADQAEVLAGDPHHARGRPR